VPSVGDAFAAAWLDLQCSQIAQATRAVVVLGEPDVGPFVPIAFWPAGSSASKLIAEAAERALEQRQPVVMQGGESFAVCEPIQLDGRLYGVMAVECTAGSVNPMAVAQVLRWGLSGVRTLLLSEQLGQAHATRERLMTTLNLIGTALAEPGFAAASHSVATELAMQLGCDRVSIGFRREDFCEVVALSHSAQFAQRMNLIRAIGAAMDEALDQNRTINLPADEHEIIVMREHAALMRQHGSDSAMTIPFLADGQLAGAFTFERTGSRPFDAAEVELLGGVVAICSRVLALRERAELGMLVRAKRQLQAQLDAFRKDGHYARKMLLYALGALFVFFLVARGEYRVTADATLEGAVQRELVAPFDGYIDSAQHRAGDVVKRGTVLAQLDDRDLRLEYLRWSGQAEEYGQQSEQGVAEHNRAAMAISQAKGDQARAQMALLADQIRRATIVAPFDGVVVSGDLSQMLGSPVKRGQELFAISPLDHYRVILEVEESEIDGVRAGQAGTLVLTAQPGITLPMRIVRVTPVVTAKEGHSYFRIEAKLDSRTAWVRPGMEGVGKIDLGSRALFWIWTHKLFDWLRLFAWTWL